LLGLVAHGQQRTDQRWQGQLAAAGEGFGEVRVSRASSKVVRGDPVGKLLRKALYKITVFVWPLRSSLSSEIFK
jgi:hypothetical protein